MLRQQKIAKGKTRNRKDSPAVEPKGRAWKRACFSFLFSQSKKYRNYLHTEGHAQFPFWDTFRCGPNFRLARLSLSVHDEAVPKYGTKVTQFL